MSGSIDGFVVEFEADGDEVTVRVAGEVDLATAGQMAAQFDRAVREFTGDVTANLAGVTFFDSTALHVLVRARSALDVRGRRLVIADPAPTTTRLFELAGLRDLFIPASGYA